MTQHGFCTLMIGKVEHCKKNEEMNDVRSDVASVRWCFVKMSCLLRKVYTIEQLLVKFGFHLVN